MSVQVQQGAEILGESSVRQYWSPGKHLGRVSGQEWARSQMPKESEGDQMSLLMCSCGCGSISWGAGAITQSRQGSGGEKAVSGHPGNWAKRGKEFMTAMTERQWAACIFRRRPEQSPPPHRLFYSVATCSWRHPWRVCVPPLKPGQASDCFDQWSTVQVTLWDFHVGS